MKTKKFIPLVMVFTSILMLLAPRIAVASAEQKNAARCVKVDFWVLPGSGHQVIEAEYIDCNCPLVPKVTVTDHVTLVYCNAPPHK